MAKEADEDAKKRPAPIKLPIGLKDDVRRVAVPIYRSIKEGKKGDLSLAETAAEFEKFLYIATRRQVVGRFFTGTSISKQGAATLAQLLFTKKIKSLKDIKDAKVADELVPDAGLFDAYLDARAAIDKVKLNRRTQSFIVYSIASGAAGKLNELVDALREIDAIETDVAKVVVQSAAPLTAAQQKEVKSSLSKHLPPGKKSMKASFEVEPSIVGGLYVTLDNYALDLSAGSFLRKFGSEMAAAQH